MNQIRTLRLVAALVLAVLAGGTFAWAVAPTLAWNSNPEPTIAGYKVYSGETSGQYTRVVDVGMNTSFPLTNVSAGVTHFFAVKAYDVNSLQSPFSEEISFTPPVDGITAVQLPMALTFSLVASVVRPTIQFSGRNGQQCWIAASSDLRQWEQIYSVTLPGGQLMEYTELGLDTKPMRFYRVVAAPR